jgi:tRNA (mo5U34)-methyltransferase
MVVAGLNMIDIKDIKWFHSIKLPDGRTTDGCKPHNLLVTEADIVFSMVDVKGKSVLDIGAWDGFFSFEAERRGAALVTASDWHCWVGSGWGKKIGFDTAKQLLNSKVEELIAKPEDIPLVPDSYDIVILLGVIYHVRNPISVINRCGILASESVIVETAYDNTPGLPAIRLLKPGELNPGDNSNYSLPNVEACRMMMQLAGMKDVKLVKHPSHPTARMFMVGTPTVKELLP